MESLGSFPSSLKSDPICMGASRILLWPLELEEEEEVAAPEGHSREWRESQRDLKCKMEMRLNNFSALLAIATYFFLC